MSRVRRLQNAPLAYRNPAFMDSKPARVLRMMAEYFDPLVRLRREGVHDTIVIFGSARICSREDALKNLARAQKGRASKEKQGRVREARNLVRMAHYYQEARELAALITNWSRKFGPMPRRFVVCSGGGPGIMEAANRGARDAGGKSIGLGIQLPFEQSPNPHISPELNFNFHYFFMRKLWFSQLAKALVVFPGGFGTMDELWEMLTLVQTGKMAKENLILLYGRKYWNQVLNLKAMVRAGTISEDDCRLLQFADNVDDAFDRVRSQMERYQMGLEGDWRP